MFRGLGRRLALFNALVVIALVALTGVATYLLLLRQLNAEVDNSLMASATQTVRSLRSTQPVASAAPSTSFEEDEHEHDAEILALILTQNICLLRVNWSPADARPR